MWVSAPLFHMALALGIRRHRKRLQLEIFYSYLVFEICRSVLLFATYQATQGPTYHAYFWLFWGSEVVEIALSVAVIYELYENALAQYDAIRGAAAMLYRWATVVLILISAVTVASTPGADSSRIMVAVLSLKQAAIIVKAGLLLLLFLAASFLGLKWKHYLLGIALGCSLHASVDLVAIAVRMRMGIVAHPTWPIVTGIVYHCSLLIWIVYLVGKERYSDVQVELPNHDLSLWNETLKEIVRR
jgi:hypothetical protein